ncbi:hypothetical protein E6W36_01260 [Hankyongella ginsenosidimutans]|uniref:TolC family protein n=1 Tax=Hankyongella ginsenosidimutans TaxID=1763828 RepID=A0A4D7C7T1_9SPHN|nr:hypothetical protein [Hankyongella ginsenosidimutans]QCI78753.1 hypothetical protein E6W36_01260 [Hankyongella ginsenosidimutans]
MTVSGKRLLLIALMLSGASKTVGAVTLNDALATAYNTSPDLGAQRAVLRQLDEDVSTAVAGTRPTITGGATFERSKTAEPSFSRRARARRNSARPTRTSTPA